jgi:menaquinone-specific isochorismate synthase
MISFDSLKLTVLKQVQELLASPDSVNPNKRYMNIDLEISDFQISEILPHITIKPISYFRSKDESAELLGLGAHEIYNRKYDYNKMLNIMDDNHDLYILGGQRFDSQSVESKEWSGFGECYFFIPKILFIKQMGKTLLRVYLSKSQLRNKNKRDSIVFEINELLNFEFKDITRPLTGDISEFPKRETWDNMIESCLHDLDKNILEKVVMCRKEVFESNDSISSYTVFNNLKENSKSSYLFYLDIGDEKAFISMTPERLFKLSDQKVEIDSIAGTRPRGESKELDDNYGYELLNSPKEIEEHRIVSREIQEKLINVCQEVKASTKESLLKLKHVQHIHSCYEGTIEKSGNFAQLINTFHPTPAVGGRPWNLAKKLIDKLEPFDRGFYAAPIGYCSKNKSEFAVGIRSALVNNNSIHLYGGCGIVRGSIAANEWKETYTKMKNFRQFL